jgi:hypothetical protein
MKANSSAFSIFTASKRRGAVTAGPNRVCNARGRGRRTSNGGNGLGLRGLANSHPTKDRQQDNGCGLQSPQSGEKNKRGGRTDLAYHLCCLRHVLWLQRISTISHGRLNRAQLQGASLAVLNLSGASLSNAQLQGTFFGNSLVWGVSLESAQLQGLASCLA